MSEYTPTKYEVLEAWVAHTSHDHPTAYDLVEAGESFNRWLAAEKAKWQAGALREAVVDMRRAWEGSWNLRDPRDPEVAYSVDVWLDRRADRIEKGSDDGRL